MTVQIWVETDQGDDVELALPSKFIVCWRCRGSGSHVNPAVDGNGLTQEDFDEGGPEFREDYMAGVYDVPCYQCAGKRVIEVPDDEKLTDAERVLWRAHVEAEEEDRATAEAERRFGA